MADQRTPNFFVAGTQKAGTSYLTLRLAWHPHIYFPVVKDPLLFNDSKFSDETYRAYLHTHFDAALDEPWVGEGKAVSYYLHNFRRGRLTGHESILELEGTQV